MLFKFYISLIILGISINQTYSQTTLIGKWRRVDPRLKVQDNNNKHRLWNDLEIHSDSTFHIEGDTTNTTSTIPGWHTGDEYNGTWELNDQSHLVLSLEPKESKLFLSYKIETLTADSLVLKSAFDTDSKYIITYFRL